MKSFLDAAVNLLHASSSGVLATHSAQLPGYPFASALPFVPDEWHRPVFFISGLAEHTKNLMADQRAGFLVTSADEHNVQTGARMTLVGDVQQVAASADLVARYLRYQPAAENYLNLGDFSFFRLTPNGVRYIAGFGQMGWIGNAEWAAAAILTLDEEAQFIQASIDAQPPGVRMLGIDCYGFDIEHNGTRERQRFPYRLKSTEIGGSVIRLLAAI
jgi:putative heme iron utilization protein